MTRRHFLIPALAVGMLCGIAGPSHAAPSYQGSAESILTLTGLSGGTGAGLAAFVSSANASNSAIVNPLGAGIATATAPSTLTTFEIGATPSVGEFLRLDANVTGDLSSALSVATANSASINSGSLFLLNQAVYMGNAGPVTNTETLTLTFSFQYQYLVSATNGPNGTASGSALIELAATKNGVTTVASVPLLNPNAAPVAGTETLQSAGYPDFFSPDFGGSSPGVFTVTLAPGEFLNIDIRTDALGQAVVVVPEPGSIALLGLGGLTLAGLPILRRRRAARA